MKGNHGRQSPEAVFAVLRLRYALSLTTIPGTQKAPTCARAMPHIPVRESLRLAALFVDPREHTVVGRALHMLLDDVQHRAQAIILLWHSTFWARLSEGQPFPYHSVVLGVRGQGWGKSSNWGWVDITGYEECQKRACCWRRAPA